MPSDLPQMLPDKNFDLSLLGFILYDEQVTKKMIPCQKSKNLQTS
jgi:predicted nicotinamide N-methyase